MSKKLTKEIVKEFCDICNFAYEAWVTHKTLFDNNHQIEELMSSSYNYFFARLSIITQEYSLLQFSKLHDPAGMNGHDNLSLRFIINEGNWEEKILEQLESLSDKMYKIMGQHIKNSRNKVISHNDLNTFACEIGGFLDGDDCNYVELLGNFINIIHEEYCGKPYKFNDLAIDDSKELLAGLQMKNTGY